MAIKVVPSVVFEFLRASQMIAKERGMQITNIKVMDGREWIRRNMGEYREEDGEQREKMPNLVDKNSEK